MKKEAEKAAKEAARKYRKDLHDSGSDCDEEGYMWESVPSDAFMAGVHWAFDWIGEQGKNAKKNKPKNNVVTPFFNPHTKQWEMVGNIVSFSVFVSSDSKEGVLAKWRESEYEIKKKAIKDEISSTND